MRAIQINEHIPDPSRMQVVTLPTLTPSPDAYLVAVHAAATNFFDLLQIQGRYQHQPPLPFVAGAEFAGVVLATPTGKGPHAFPVGTAVFGSSQGAYSTHVLAPEAALRRVPAGWTALEAAGLMVTAPTSYAAIVTRARTRPGETVLVHAAAGGVGLAAVQVAKAAGARVIAAASSAAKLAVAARFGADAGVDYTASGWEAAVRALTPGGRGVDVVFDPVGLVGPSLKCAAWDARIVVVGFAAGSIESVAMNRVLLKNVALVGLHWGQYVRQEPEAFARVWRELGELIDGGRFRPTLYSDREFVGLESVPEALRALGARETWGKVVVKVPHEGESKL